MINISKSKFEIAAVLIFSILILIFGCDKEVTRTPVEPPPPQGFIYINSIPDGFTIFQNDKNTGRLTPDSISYIDAGNYKITLRKKYFKDTSIVVTIGENERFNLNVDLVSNPSMYGNLFLQSQPEGADIIINDSSINKVTPQTLKNLFPGEYQIKFRLSNYRDTEISAIVQSSQTNNYVEELRDTSEWVDYKVFNSGIQSNSLSTIIIDNMNNKWIGTLDAGLIKYDDKIFTNFSTSNSSIPANKINCINMDNQNRIWIGTDFGIGILNGSSWTVYNASNSGLTTELINSIKFDNNGTAWIGTAGNLVKFDGVSWTVYNEPSGKDWINDLLVKDINKIWLGSRSDGIRIFENETFDSLLQLEYGYLSNTVSSIAIDNFTNIWFGFLPDTAGRGGLSSWDGSSFTNFLFGTPQNNINNVFIDSQNNKLLASSEGFILFDEQNNTILFNTFNSLISANNVSASFRDQAGNIWITTIAGGLNKYKPPQ
jgi:sugar lactone lactonase YvrE